MCYEYEEPYNDYVLKLSGWFSKKDKPFPDKRDEISYEISVYKNAHEQHKLPVLVMRCSISGFEKRKMTEEELVERKKQFKDQLIQETKRKIDSGDFTNSLDIKYG